MAELFGYQRRIGAYIAHVNRQAKKKEVAFWPVFNSLNSKSFEDLEMKSFEPRGNHMFFIKTENSNEDRIEFLVKFVANSSDFIVDSIEFFPRKLIDCVQ